MAAKVEKEFGLSISKLTLMKLGKGDTREWDWE
jgi:hypothetical protein